MYKIITTCFLLILVACNNSKKSDSPAGKDDTTTAKTTNTTTATGPEQFLEELRNLAPLGSDELKAKLPATIMGAAVTDAEYNESMGAGLVTGQYVVSDSSKITINIYDCAGDGGAGVYNMQYTNMIDVKIENENDYTKPITIGGVKGYEQCQKQSNDCSITWFAGKRFLVSMESENISAGELIAEAKKISF